MSYTVTFKECNYCREGFDTDGPSEIRYPGQEYFCINCSNALAPNGWKLIDDVREWADTFNPASYQRSGLILSMFNALRTKAPREALYNAIIYYTGGKLESTIKLSEILEGYSEFLENKSLKPLESNYNVKPVIERPPNNS